MKNGCLMPPEFLYKYTTASKAEIILRTGRLRWSSPSMFNDLAEFQRMPLFNPPIEEALSIFLKKIIDISFSGNFQNGTQLSDLTKQLLVLVSAISKTGMSKNEVFEELNAKPPYDQEHISKVLREHTQQEKYISTARVCCLTSSFNNDVMWAHYAKNHTGCVLGFRHIEKLDTPFKAAKPVIYTHGRLEVYDGVDFLLYGNTKELQKKILEGICYSKDQKWSYEEEWRGVTWRKDEEHNQYSDFLFNPEELESITFGLNIKESNENSLKELVSNKFDNCEMYKILNGYGELKRIKIG
jgi:hypothetical protein